MSIGALGPGVTLDGGRRWRVETVGRRHGQGVVARRDRADFDLSGGVAFVLRRVVADGDVGRAIVQRHTRAGKRRTIFPGC